MKKNIMSNFLNRKKGRLCVRLKAAAVAAACLAASVIFSPLFFITVGGGQDESENDTISENAYVLTARISPPAHGLVTSPFGQRVHPITKTDGFHTGIDIAAALGTPVYAAMNGTACEVGESQAYGNYLIIKHSDGLYTFYGHCESIRAKEGMVLRRGEVVALMGSTGYSTGPHLHFEIRIDERRVDPAYALRDKKELEF